MKNLIIVIVLVITCLFHPYAVQAHSVGFPPYSKINDKFANTNPIQTLGLTIQSFPISQDIAPENYIVNEPIHFDIDQKQLKSIIAGDFLSKTTYFWNFGDGSTSEGLHTIHTFSKIGTYFVTLTLRIAVDSEQPSQFVDTYMLDVLPGVGFNGLPEAVMKVNGKTYHNQSSKIITYSLKNKIFFSAEDSVNSSKITDYLWNFGDGTTATGKTVTHIFNKQSYDVVILRMKDTNGFISDDYIALHDVPTSYPLPISPVPTITNKIKTLQKQDSIKNILFTIVIVFLFIASWLINKKMKI